MTLTKFGTARALSGIALLALTACEGFDSDFRGATGGFSTADAAQQAPIGRPDPDARGVITYPNYQVAVAQRGDTVTDVATRIGTDAQQLASFNGLPIDAPLRSGEVIALPKGSIATAAAPINPTAPASVDVTTLAGQAIDAAPATPASTAVTTAPIPEAQEPIRHKVARGETAFSIARLYKVPVRTLARWNGLGPQFTIREGQFLLIPVANTPPPAAPTAETVPGQGSPTPTPPSAEKPLPEDDTEPAASAKAPPKVDADLGKATKTQSEGRFAFPVQGTIIRDYAKGRNESINIKGAPGDPVRAADTGTVAAITESAEGVPIIVVRHEQKLLTVYANVTDVLVKKGDTVRRGQGLAKLRPGDQSFVHFEVREGFDSVDPNAFLN